MMPSPKENELIEKVIEFDQSIESNYRERETCAANGLRFCLFFMRSKRRQHSSPFCYITHQIKITLHCLSLSLSLISKSKTKSYLELYGDRLAWDFWMLLNSTVTGPFGIPEQQFSHFKHTYTHFYAFFHFYVFQKITKKKKPTNISSQTTLPNTPNIFWNSKEFCTWTWITAKLYGPMLI